MKKSRVRTIACITALFCASPLARADSLLGANYVVGKFGLIRFGDDELNDALGTGYGLSSSGNFNFHPSMDLKLSLSYIWGDGEIDGVELEASSLGAVAALVHFFGPYTNVRPFISAGLGVVKSDVDGSAFGVSKKSDETDPAFVTGAGMEHEATEEILIRLAIDYKKIDDKDIVDLSAALNYWLSDKLLGALGGIYDLKSEDVTAWFGLAVKL